MKKPDYTKKDVELAKNLKNQGYTIDYSYDPNSVAMAYNKMQEQFIIANIDGYSGKRKVGAIYMFCWRVEKGYYDHLL